MQSNTGDSSIFLEKQETGELLRQALGQLSPQDATALDLFYFREQSIEEIGQITGWTASNIKSRLSRARQRLHNVLVNEGLAAEYCFA
jgi:RNA polymerase sigma-70 factor (ECF subfamily)